MKDKIRLFGIDSFSKVVLYFETQVESRPGEDGSDHVILMNDEHVQSVSVLWIFMAAFSISSIFIFRGSHIFPKYFHEPLVD